MIPDYLKAQHEIDIRIAREAGVPDSLLSAIDELTDDQRRALFLSYCTDCGAADTTCVCMRDC